MMEYIELLAWPFLAALVITGIHVYLGLHVVSRGVIFVDLALAQLAALGTAVGLIIGLEENATSTYAVALCFTIFGALLFSFTRSKKSKIPQEAIIGITYVVSAAIMILLFSKSPEGSEHLNHILVGSILFVTPKIIGLTLILYVTVGMFHWVFRKEMIAVSFGHNTTGGNTQLWDFLFYVSFGFVVTSSVKIAGILLVFSFLIIPSIAGLLFIKGIKNRLLFGWVFSIVGSAMGMAFSLIFDIPTGATIVVTFGLMLAAAGIIKLIMD